MDETVVNGANLFFAEPFGINPNAQDGNASRNQWIFGLVNSAPYVRRTPLQRRSKTYLQCTLAVLRRHWLLAH